MQTATTGSNTFKDSDRKVTTFQLLERDSNNVITKSIVNQYSTDQNGKLKNHVRAHKP